VGFYLSITYTLAHFFIKMSILLFYIRIFTLHITWFRIGIYTTMAYVTGWALSLLVLIFGQWYDRPGSNSYRTLTPIKSTAPLFLGSL
jgi:hypothetical protein